MKFKLSPIAYDGWKFVVVFIIMAFLFLYFGVWFAKAVGGICLLLAGFCVYFFRDPERVPPADPEAILAPADGVVLEVVTVEDEGYGPGRVIRIFLSVFDVHIQRSPCAGVVRSVKYMPGLFLDARDPRAPFANESNAIEISGDKGRVVVKQIAGLIARRIISWVRVDDAVAAGERIGLIRFGSQVDLYIPSGAEMQVKEGDRVYGGESILARWTAGHGGA
jgi:phosphatidylserine decarboxylase